MDDILFLRVTDTENPFSNNEWLLANSKGKILKIANNNEDVKTISDTYGNNLSIFLIIPDMFVSFHIIDLPIKERKKQLQAIPFILEEQIISDIDDTHFVIGPRVDHDQYIVAVIDKKHIEEILRKLEEALGKKPTFMLTEAMCLYRSDLELNKYNLYFNKEANSLLFYNKNIIHTELDNASLVLSEVIKTGSFTADIYKYKIDNIADILKDSIKNITISSEQEIDNWLAFLVSTWFKNNNTNKLRSIFNLLHGYIKFSTHNIKFNNIWKHTAVIASGLVGLYIGYKYLDNLLFANYKQQLSQSIKTELQSVNIKSTDLTMVEKALNTNIAKIKNGLDEAKKKNIFYTVLSSYAQYSIQEMTLKDLNYANDVMSINFEISKDNIKLLERIKEKLANDNIFVQEQILSKGKMTEFNWQLTLNQ